MKLDDNDQWRPLEERRDDQTYAFVQYLWGAQHRDDLARRDRVVGTGTALNETRYVLMDYFSPAAITDASGTVTERYAFGAFGFRTIMAPDFSHVSASECGFEFAFQGQFQDGESGMLNYGYRYYAPGLGRWISKDPIGEVGGLNLFLAFGNDAMNVVDHLGLAPKPVKVTPPSGKYTRWTLRITVEIELEKIPGKNGTCPPSVSGMGTASVGYAGESDNGIASVELGPHALESAMVDAKTKIPKCCRPKAPEPRIDPHLTYDFSPLPLHMPPTFPPNYPGGPGSGTSPGTRPRRPKEA